VAFATGIAAGASLHLSILLSASVGLAGCGALGVLKSRDGPSRRAVRAAMAGLLALVWSCAGAGVCASRHARFMRSPLLRAVRASPGSSEVFIVRAWIADDPVRRDGRLRFLAQVERVQRAGIWGRCPGTVRVVLRDPDPLLRVAYGDRLEMPLRLREAKNFGNPGSFDYRGSLEADGIHLLGNLKSWRLVKHLPGPGGPRLPRLIHRLRTRLIRRLARAFHPGEGEGAKRFLAEILVGARDGGEERLDRVMKRTGVYHIVSISGLHFALLMSLVGGLGRRLSMGRVVEVPCLLLVGGFYLLLSGGEDPIFRCALAGAVQACGRLTGRRVSGWNAQSTAAVVLLALHPLHLFGPSFQLSFVATWGILACEQAAWSRLRSVPLVGRGFCLSIGAWSASTPIMAFTFQQASPVAFVMNLLAGPFLALSLLVGVALMIAPWEALGRCYEECLSLFEASCEGALSIPLSFRHVPPPSWALLGGLAILQLSHAAPGCNPRERRMVAAGVILGLALIVFPLPAWFPPDRMSMTALDVGQGDSLLLILPGNHAILIDAGGFSDTEFDVGEKVVLPALLTMGVGHLDLAVLTHAHQDHGGGLPAILEALPVDELWLGRCPRASPLVDRITDLARKEGIPWLHPTRGSLRCFGETCIEVMHPPPGYRPDEPASNDDSLVLRIRYRSSALLLTGDVESAGEALVLRGGSSVESEALKVAHHGSASSTSIEFLRRVSPRFAIISVGEGNPWGHPSPTVLDRLRRAGAATLRTDRMGAVAICSDGSHWSRCPAAR